MAVASDGTIWFDENGGHFIDRIAPDGTITRFDNGAATQASGLTAAPDGSVWFKEATSGRVRRIASDGTITTVATVAGAYGMSIGAFDANGDFWTVAYDTHELVRITPVGGITRITRTSSENPVAVAIDADGTIWWNEDAAIGFGYRTSAGTMGFVRRPLADLSQAVWQVKRGPDGHVWAVDPNNQDLIRTTGPGTIEDVSLGGSSAGSPYSFTFLPDGTAWVPAFQGIVTTRTAAGVVTPHAAWTPSVTWGAVVGLDGNVWSTNGATTGITRTLTGIVPESTTAPAVTGTGAVSAVLTTDDGTWRYLPTATTRRWERCTTAASGCTTIPGETTATYTVSADDAGLYVRSVVTATNLNGPASAASTSIAIPAPVPAAAPAPASGAGAITSPAASIAAPGAAATSASAFTAANASALLRGRTLRVTTAVSLPGAGAITQTVRLGRRNVCTATAQATVAGRQTIACSGRVRLGASARRRGVAVTVVTTFAPAGGVVQTRTQTISARSRG
jgi:virginiamycin B lyase